MSDLDGIYTWIMLLSDVSSDKAVEIKRLVTFVNTIFNEEQLNIIESKFNTIKDLSDAEFTVDQFTAISLALEDIVKTIEPFLKGLKNVISNDDINYLNENMSTFIQVLIMTSLYKYRDEINAAQIANALQALCEIATVSLKINELGWFSKLFNLFKCCKKNEK